MNSQEIVEFMLKYPWNTTIDLYPGKDGKPDWTNPEVREYALAQAAHNIAIRGVWAGDLPQQPQIGQMVHYVTIHFKEITRTAEEFIATRGFNEWKGYNVLEKARLEHRLHSLFQSGKIH